MRILHLDRKPIGVIIFTFIVSSVTIGSSFGSEKNNNKEEIFTDRVNVPFLHTVILRSAAWEMARPVLVMGTEQKLELMFDDLSAIPHTYTYTLVHCSTDWQRSDLEAQESLSGMGSGTLDEPEPSRNTTLPYLHYSLVFPNEECQPVISGNWVITVFETGQPDIPVLTRRFLITENLADIQARITEAPDVQDRETCQQVAVTVSLDNLRLRDAGNELQTIVRQNGREDNRISLKPSFRASDRIVYEGTGGGIFKAGNEYRTLDIRNMRYQTENIAEIAFRDRAYQVTLKPDEERAYKPYFNKTDLDGNFMVNVEKSDHKHLEADYVYVNFLLRQPFPFEEPVYVFGGLTGWALDDENLMHYDQEKQQYTCTLLLKQGYYDYDYALRRKADRVADEETIEGSYRETGNSYEVLVYQHERFDRLIGYKALK
jgi:hypothetical protein